MSCIKNLCLISVLAMILASVVSASEIDNGKMSIFLDNTSQIYSHTYNEEGLKPMPKGSYQTAALFFLPDLDSGETGFGNYDQIANDYNRGNCGDDGSLYTTSNCSYPRTLIASSQCPFRPGSYTRCECLPEFKISSCPAPKSLSSPLCNGKAQRCVCPPSVVLSNSNDKCTQYCDGLCIAKNCTPLANEPGCSYGTTTASNGCGGTRTVCKACTPLANETGCAYGTTTASDSCGGTRTICKACVPLTNETGCSYGTTTASNGCGGTRTVCKGCIPLTNETGCSYGTTTASNGCGGTRTICKGCVPLTSETGCAYGTTTASDNCGGTRTICKACVPLTNETGCSHGTTTASNGCGGTRTVCKSYQSLKVTINAAKECPSNITISGYSNYMTYDGSMRYMPIQCPEDCIEKGGFNGMYSNQSETVLAESATVNLINLNPAVSEIENQTRGTIIPVKDGAVTFQMTTYAEASIKADGAGYDFWTLKCSKSSAIPNRLKLTIDIADNCPSNLGFSGNSSYTDYDGSIKHTDIQCNSNCSQSYTYNSSETILHEGAAVNLINLNPKFTYIKSVVRGTIIPIAFGNVTFNMTTMAEAQKASSVTKNGYDVWRLNCNSF